MVFRNILVLFLVCSLGTLKGQNLSVSASYGFGTRITEIPPFQQGVVPAKRIQFLNSYLFEIGKDVLPTFNVGLSASYTDASTGRAFIVGPDQIASVPEIRYYGVGLYGRYRIFSSYRVQPYIYGSTGMLLNYPKKMGYRGELESGLSGYADARLGLEFEAKKWLSCFGEFGAAYKRGITRFGIVFRVSGNEAKASD